ncbi:LOB domain-containing protein 14 [Hibiscus syriacus]|uniref:LOB domain-containing protein 14 n=1 Tax=Hibiscus syriacus TaxID=106335 RepID=A0A6A2YZQ1_HIBSY|nr:LOB domain-containing protein 29-like [Hibiscus syriacus]KAE8685038.1 LOB domain-containing protein 14 [Hibiscus syriacus]
MTGSGSPCGACKFLRRKCVKGCVFAPYFCREQGAAHFASIHKVFGASNVSKLLAHLPVSERSEAAVTISYEAQARLQDPIYGCVSHIFALQQQVVNLQAQLASLKEQAAQSSTFNGSVTANPNENNYGNLPSQQLHDDVQSWFHPHDSTMAQSNFNPSHPNHSTAYSYCENRFLDPTSLGNYESSSDRSSFTAFDGEAPCSMSSFGQWSFEDADNLQPIAFGYAHHS